jgi:hypothetical protein
VGFVGESLKCATKWRCNGTFFFFFEEWMEGQGEAVERERWEECANDLIYFSFIFLREECFNGLVG